MALNEIIRTTKPAFDSIVAGTHATETYNDNNEYQVALDAPLEVAAAGSHMSVNNSNQLVVVDEFEEVKYTAQSLNSTQKAQARANINCYTAVEYTGTETSYADQTWYYVVED